jgi:hypothetical protein
MKPILVNHTLAFYLREWYLKTAKLEKNGGNFPTGTKSVREHDHTGAERTGCQ